MGMALNVSTYVQRGSRTYETFCSLSARQTGEGRRQMSATQQSATLLLLKVCKTKDERNSQNSLRAPNTLKRHHHHHYHRHYHRHCHHHFIINLAFTL